MRHLLVKSEDQSTGTIENVLIYEPGLSFDLPPGHILVLYDHEDHEPAGIGWAWDGEKAINPNPDTSVTRVVSVDGDVL